MKRIILAAVSGGLILPQVVLAQSNVAPPAATGAASASAPAPAPAAVAGVLPANTEVTVAMNSDLTTKGGRVDVGYTFDLTVTQDVKVGETVVIPKGSPAKGEIVWLTGKGAFGKSGKMEIELRYIDANGRRIPISGRYRQEGEGNTVGTVAGVVAVGVFAAFITGKSARIPQGRELKAFTKEAIPVSGPGTMPTGQ